MTDPDELDEVERRLNDLEAQVDMARQLERQADALERIADELGYLNGAMTLVAEHVAPGGYTVEAIAEEVDFYRDVRDREVLRR